MFGKKSKLTSYVRTSPASENRCRSELKRIVSRFPGVKIKVRGYKVYAPSTGGVEYTLIGRTYQATAEVFDVIQRSFTFA